MCVLQVVQGDRKGLSQPRAGSGRVPRGREQQTLPSEYFFLLSFKGFNPVQSVVLTRMGAFMDLEILAACKDLATAGMGAGKGFLAGMDAYVIH